MSILFLLLGIENQLLTGRQILAAEPYLPDMESEGNFFPAWVRIRWFCCGVKPVLSYTENSCILS